VTEDRGQGERNFTERITLEAPLSTRTLHHPKRTLILIRLAEDVCHDGAWDGNEI